MNSLSEDVMCAVAVYEKTADGALILKKVELESQAVLPGKTWSATTKAVTGVAGNVVKAFLWKGNNEPVINGVEKTITAE